MEKTKAGRFIPLPMVPMALVGADVGGRPNFTAVGFVNGVNIAPPIICVSLNKRHHTPKGIIQNRTFSINVPSAAYAGATDYCGLVSGAATDKSKIFKTFYGELKTAPMIQEFPITCECAYIGKKIEFAMDTVYFGEVRQVYLSPDLVTADGARDIMKADPLILGMDNSYRLAGEKVAQAYSVGWEFREKADTPMRDGYFEAYRCALTEERAQPTLSVRYENVTANIPRLIGQAFMTIGRYAAARKVRPGLPFVASHGPDGHGTALEVGMTFGQPIEGTGDLRSGELPCGKYASCIHVGPYEKAGTSRAVLRQWMARNGYEGIGISYEFYLNDPRTTKKENLETRIALPLK